jgi:uncharacterized protein (TIGR02145 family)
MEEKTSFIIKETDSMFYVCNTCYEDSPVIETHNGNPYPGLPKNVAELLCEDLNSLPAEHALFSEYNVSLVYCVLSTFIEAKGEYNFPVDLPYSIQWDRVFRLDPGPPHNQFETKSIEKVISFLKGKWVDLTLNYCQSVEEMRENKVPEVPKNIIKDLQKLLSNFNDTETFAVDLLFNLFNRISISSAIFWVAGIFDNEDIQKVYLYFYKLKKSSRLTNNEKIQMAGMSERLEFLRKLIELAKRGEIVVTTKVKNVSKKTIKSPNDKFKSVLIGSQVWMAENLSVDSFRNGDKIPQIKTKKSWEEARKNKLPGWCYYDFKASNGKIFGKLYNWYAVSDPRDLSPVGWRIALDNDWKALVDFLGGENAAGKHLKSKEEWPNPEDNMNSSGFNGLPAGMYGTSIFNQIRDAGFFWTPNWFESGDTPNGCYYCLNKGNGVVIGGYFQWCFFSVRCLRD